MSNHIRTTALLSQQGIGKIPAKVKLFLLDETNILCFLSKLSSPDRKVRSLLEKPT